MSVTSDTTAPYAPASAILEVISRYRDHGLTAPFTRDVLARAGVSDSLVPRTLQALKTLDLIDDSGEPTEALRRIATARTDEYPGCLADWLRAAYAEVFKFVNPEKDDEQSIRDAFRTYQPRGQQTRMVTLFLALCREAGIRSGDVEEAAAPRPRRTRSRRDLPRPQGGEGSRRKQTSGGGRAGVLPEPLAGLLADLPDNRRWTKEQRDKFVTTFNTVLDYCVKVVDRAEVEEDD